MSEQPAAPAPAPAPCACGHPQSAHYFGDGGPGYPKDTKCSVKECSCESYRPDPPAAPQRPEPWRDFCRRHPDAAAYTEYLEQALERSRERRGGEY